MNDAIVRAVIVGCGFIGLNHARAIGRHPRMRVSALVDPDPTATASLADDVMTETGAPRPGEFRSLSEALAGADIDVVVVCTPSGLHVVVAGEAVAAGKHVVIEKPLDVSLSRARQILELSRRAEEDGLVVSVISQHRFDPASRVVADAAHSGRFGRLTSGVASVPWYRSQEYFDSGQWRGTWALDGGGAVMNQGIHTVDLLVWFLGRPTDIDARTALLVHERIEVEDVAVVTLRFESGALAVLHATTAAFPELSVRIQIHGDHGSAVIDDEQLEFFATDGAPENCAADVVSPSDLRGGERDADRFVLGHFRQYADIYEAIRDRRQPGMTVGDAYLSLAVVRGIYLSATLGRSVTLDEVLDGSLDGIVVVTEKA